MSRRSTLLQMLLDEESSSDDDKEFISLAIDIVHNNDDEFILGHAVINRERLVGHRRLYKNYFSEEPTYLPVQFRRSQHEKIQDKEVHNQLREDLIEHLWNHHVDRY
uniref:Uncharacterized protein n=1 Tax=Oryza punctata TaxID=4537 RepID=A0A0E0KIN6_ORYPU